MSRNVSKEWNKYSVPKFPGIEKKRRRMLYVLLAYLKAAVRRNIYTSVRKSFSLLYKVV